MFVAFFGRRLPSNLPFNHHIRCSPTTSLTVIAWLPVILQKYIVGSNNRGNHSTTHLPWYLSSPSNQKADPIVGPYPEFVIASGGRAIAPCLEVAKRSMGQSFTGKHI